ncbi:mechanosensitive ion channel family protein [Methanoculleus taiwanensis]|nr:mechanosensitive ion channel domain-containing protein [Methanoculleus taiwanensis]
MNVTPDSITDLGAQVGQALIILIVTGIALVAARVVMRRVLWPALRKPRLAPSRQMLSLVEQFVYLLIIVFGLHQVVRVVAPGVLLFDDIFFLFYWLLGIYFAVRLVSATADWYLGVLAPRFDGTTHEKVVSPIKYILYIVIFALAAIILMDFFGITGTALTTSLAALGVTTLVVGLAAENIINDIITGLVIRVDQPFRPGDRIEILELNTWGDVQEVGWRSTRILTRDKRMVTIPNSLIGKNLVTNYSIPDKFFRVETDVAVAYGADIEVVRQLIQEAVEEQDWVVRDRPIQVLLWEFRDTGVLIRARCWIEDYVDTRIVVDQLNTAIYRRLFERGFVSGPVSDIALHTAEGEEHREGA